MLDGAFHPLCLSNARLTSFIGTTTFENFIRVPEAKLFRWCSLISVHRQREGQLTPFNIYVALSRSRGHYSIVQLYLLVSCEKEV